MAHYWAMFCSGPLDGSETGTCIWVALYKSCYLILGSIILSYNIIYQGLLWDLSKTIYVESV